LLVALHGGVLAPLAFGDYRFVVLPGDGRLEVYPAAMHGARGAPSILGVSAEAAHGCLEVGLGALDVLDASMEDFLRSRVPDRLGGVAESLHAVLTRLDEVIEHGDDVVVVHCHGHAPAAEVKLVPGAEALRPAL